ncbi:MAG: RNA polymerase sigma factor [Solirubrobacterales bacterium]
MVEFEDSESAGRVALSPRSVTERSDRDLMRVARAGSSDAAEALIERHWDGAHRIAFAILGDAHAAEDVTQDAMISLLRSIGRFDLRRPLAPWLHRIVTNRALDWRRARTRRAEVASIFASPATEVGPDSALSAALAELPPEQAALVALRYIGGYGPEEIAQMLGLRRGTVGSRLRRTLDQLRIRLEEDDG